MFAIPLGCKEWQMGCPASADVSQDLGLAAATKRSTSVVMILEKPLKGDHSEGDLKSFKEDCDDVRKEINELAVAAFKK